MMLYARMLAGEPGIRVPGVFPELSTGRLLTMRWLDGRPLLDYRERGQEERNRIAATMFRAWWHPFVRHGVIHGDPHLGNYTIYEEEGRASGINLLDYGCIRIFPAAFVAAVLDLYHGLKDQDEARIVHAYESWGFRGLDRELIDILNIWARFIYGPLLEDRVRTIAGDVSPAEYGRREAWRVRQALRAKGPVTVPREFVFMDRAAIGLGAVFLHLRAELNFYRLFNAAIEDFEADRVAGRQAESLTAAGLT